MTGTNSTVDGMGFDEVNQLVTSTEVVSGGTILGNTITGATIGGTNIAGTTVSGVTLSGGNTRLRNCVVTGSYMNLNGTLQVVELGSPVVYGATVKAGSVLTTAGSLGFITFGTSFSNSTWYCTLMPGSNITTPGSAIYISGLRHASGAYFVGEPSMKYDWIAVGI